MAVTLKVLTLNCWGIPVPGLCQVRSERIDAIAKELGKGQYDIVVLQEVWSQSDYSKLYDAISSKLQFAHYFHSGMFGSGVCLFTKHPILETFQYRFALNGYAHRVYHGDWFGGKCVGLAKVFVDGFSINVYAGHLHAQYSDVKDDYLAHRVSQSYQLSEFIKLTSEGCDAVIAAGDFNLQPTDLGYKIIITNGNIQDAWLSQRRKTEDDMGFTCDRPDNSFTKQPTDFPGKRLDYIFIRSNSGCTMECESCHLAMRKIPNSTFNYSDHEGVAAELVIKPNVTAMAPPRDIAGIERNFTDAIPILEQGEKNVKGNQVVNIVVFFLCLVALTATSSLGMPLGLQGIVSIFRTLLTIQLGICVWTVVVLANNEINALTATKKDLNNTLRSNRPA